VNDAYRDAGPATRTASRLADSADAELLSRIGAGDEGAMAAFYRQHGRALGGQDR
jgi:hypothetical protein